MCTTSRSAQMLTASNEVPQLVFDAAPSCGLRLFHFCDCTYVKPQKRIRHSLQGEKHRKFVSDNSGRHGLSKLERASLLRAQGLDASVDRKRQEQLQESKRRKKLVVVGAAGVVVDRASVSPETNIVAKGARNESEVESPGECCGVGSQGRSNSSFDVGPLLSKDVNRGARETSIHCVGPGMRAPQDEEESTESAEVCTQSAPNGPNGDLGTAVGEGRETAVEAQYFKTDSSLYIEDDRHHAASDGGNDGGSELESGTRSGDADPDEVSDAEESASSDDWFDADLDASSSDDEASSSESAFSTRPGNVRSSQGQASAARQTADNRRPSGARVATSRILEASDFTNASLGEAIHWDEHNDLSPSVSIYTKQARSADSESRARIPRKKERHKAKTYRRLALERQSKLASAGLPPHLEAEEQGQHTEPASLAHTGSPLAASSNYKGFRCEVCRRLKKGGCGTPRARPACLKRLLLFPQAADEDEEGEGLHTQLGLLAYARPMVEYLTSLGFSFDELLRLREKNASTFRLSVDPVKARVDFLLSLGVDLPGLRSMVNKHSNVLRYHIDRVMKPRVDFLKHLGVPEDEIPSVITSHPSLLELSAKNVEPKVLFLIHAVGISRNTVIDIVRRHPQLLERSIERQLQPTLDYFVNELGVPCPAFAKMVCRHPQLLQYSRAGLARRIEFLTGIGLTPEERVVCITRFAQLLSLSVDNCLRPKYEYLTSHLGGGKKTVVEFPQFFSLSLKKRIVPRYKQLCTLDHSGRPFSKSLLMWMLRLSNEHFAVELAKRKDCKRGGSESLGSPDGELSQARKSRDVGIAQDDRRIENLEEDRDPSVQALVASSEHTEASAAAETSSTFLDTVGSPGRFRRKVTW